MNPDKKGEEVTDKIAGLSEELMNTLQPCRGGVPVTRPRSTVLGVGVGRREWVRGTMGHPLEIWGAGYPGGKLKGHGHSPVR